MIKGGKRKFSKWILIIGNQNASMWRRKLGSYNESLDLVLNVCNKSWWGSDSFIWINSKKRRRFLARSIFWKGQFKPNNEEMVVQIKGKFSIGGANTAPIDNDLSTLNAIPKCWRRPPNPPIRLRKHWSGRRLVLQRLARASFRSSVVPDMHHASLFEVITMHSCPPPLSQDVIFSCRIGSEVNHLQIHHLVKMPGSMIPVQMLAWEKARARVRAREAVIQHLHRTTQSGCWSWRLLPN